MALYMCYSTTLGTIGLCDRMNIQPRTWVWADASGAVLVRMELGVRRARRAYINSIVVDAINAVIEA